MPSQIDLIKKYDLSVRGHLGQHLLIDPNVQKKIVKALAPAYQEHVLEIGPGLGALTRHLLASGCFLVAIEKDARFVEILETELKGISEVPFEILHSDVLKIDLEKTLVSRSKRWKVASNLPYYVTAPILFALVECRDYIETAVLMMQKEVAKRIMATPGTKDYGRLTLALRYFADTKHLFDVKPSCFTPRPAVDSSVLEVKFHAKSERPEGVDEDRLFKVIRVAFSQRRKTLLNSLQQNKEDGWVKSRLESIFDKLGYSKSVRAEELLLKDFIALSAELAD